MINGGTLPKEDGSRVAKDVKNTCIRDKAPVIGIVNDNVLPRSSMELSGRDATPRPRNVHDDGHKAKSNIDDISSSQGKFSPDVYFDEANLATYGDHNGSNAKAKHSMEIDAYVDDEDSKNVPEGGDDVSGTKSKGEAEGIEDANFISADGTYSDHILLTAKSLAKCMASPLHDDPPYHDFSLMDILSGNLTRHAEGRKGGARLFGGHFIRHLAAYFGLVSDEGLRGLERQPDATAGAPELVKDAFEIFEGGPGNPALMQAPHPPHVALRTMP
nr:hypothetical protein [Tanacetum cinerariifolium]